MVLARRSGRGSLPLSALLLPELAGFSHSFDYTLGITCAHTLVPNIVASLAMGFGASSVLLLS